MSFTITCPSCHETRSSGGVRFSVAIRCSKCLPNDQSHPEQTPARRILTAGEWNKLCRAAGLAPASLHIDTLTAPQRTWVHRLGDALDRLASNPSQPGVACLLVGPTGAGKTHLMLAAARHLATTAGLGGDGIRYGWESTVIAPASESRFEQPRNVAGWLAPARLVLLDELGRGIYRATDGGLDPMATFLDRARVGKVVVAATNFASLDDLERHYRDDLASPHVASRLHALIGDNVLHVGDRDLRRR